MTFFTKIWPQVVQADVMADSAIRDQSPSALSLFHQHNGCRGDTRRLPLSVHNAWQRPRQEGTREGRRNSHASKIFPESFYVPLNSRDTYLLSSRSKHWGWYSDQSRKVSLPSWSLCARGSQTAQIF